MSFALVPVECDDVSWMSSYPNKLLLVYQRKFTGNVALCLYEGILIAFPSSILSLPSCHFLPSQSCWSSHLSHGKQALLKSQETLDSNWIFRGAEESNHHRLYLQTTNSNNCCWFPGCLEVGKWPRVKVAYPLAHITWSSIVNNCWW